MIEENVKNKIAAILDAQNESLQQAEKKKEERIQQLKKNLADFFQKRSLEIRPAMEELVYLFKAKGRQDVYISEEDEQPPGTQKSGPSLPSISLHLANAAAATQAGPPRFSLYFDKEKRSVRLYTVVGNTAGTKHETPLDNITANWVHEEFLKYFQGDSSSAPAGLPPANGR